MRTLYVVPCRNKVVCSLGLKHLLQSKERQNHRFPWQHLVNSQSAAYCIPAHGGLVRASAQFPEQKTQYSAAHFVLAKAVRGSGQLETAFSGGCVLFLKSEQLILTRLFHLLLGLRNPDIQLQAPLLCLPSESVKATLNEKPQSFHKSSVCSDKPSDAWLLCRTAQHQSEVLSPNLPLNCNLAFFGKSHSYSLKVIWTRKAFFSILQHKILTFPPWSLKPCVSDSLPSVQSNRESKQHEALQRHVRRRRIVQCPTTGPKCNSFEISSIQNSGLRILLCVWPRLNAFNFSEG